MRRMVGMIWARTAAVIMNTNLDVITIFELDKLTLHNIPFFHVDKKSNPKDMVLLCWQSMSLFYLYI